MPSTGCIGASATPEDAADRAHPDPPLAELIAAAQRGDQDAVGEIYGMFWPMVFKYAYHRVASWHLAEDIAAETFARVQCRIGTFTWRPGHVFEAWLVTIARNLIADHYKRHSTQRELLTGELFDLDVTTPSPECDAVRAAEQEALGNAISRLIPSQRQCVTLRYLYQMSTRDTAEIMGKRESAVKTLLWRALNSLAADRSLSDWTADR